MTRKEALQNIGILTALAFVSSSSVLSSCNKPAELSTVLTDADISMLNEIGELIIPTTPGIPGAKAANTGQYIQMIIQDCTNEESRVKFMDGWHHMQVLGKEKYHQDVANLSAKEKLDYVTALDKYTPIGDDKDKSDLAISAFQKIKQLTLKGYFTSEIGATKALRYDPVPGKFVGIIPYKKGNKVWATNM